MKIKLYRHLGLATLAIGLCCQPPSAVAEIVSTDQITAQHNVNAERAQVQAFVDRASARNRLQALGLNGLVAKDRIAALSDQEVHALAEKIDSLPAGGNFGNFTNDQLIIILLIAILVAVIAS